MSSEPTPSPPHSATTPRRLVSDEKELTPPSPANPGALTEPPPLLPSRTPAFPGREDCWSEEATRTLIEAWGSHYLNLNRGNLRQKHWQEVADTVNSVHAAASPKLRRTDVQCKNRIDTTKKKFMVEKSKVIQSHGRYVSSWPHFQSLDALIGDSFSKTPTSTNNTTKNPRRRISPPPELSPSPPPETEIRHRNSSPAIHRRDKDSAANHPLRLTWSVPVGPRSKRSGPGSVTERNFSVMAAAAAAIEAEEDEGDEDGSGDDEGWGTRVRRDAPAVGRKRKAAAEADEEEREGYRMLAEAIMRVGQIYERVEVAKQRQMVEFEKQRMQFAKDLEILRTQLQLDHLKRARCNSRNIEISFSSCLIMFI